MAAWLVRLEQRVTALEGAAGRRLTLPEIRDEVARRLRSARRAGDFAHCRRLKDMLARIDAPGPGDADR
jgi:hypothetical protein